jgi:methyl-coenzyme M reductase gamma subunit
MTYKPQYYPGATSVAVNRRKHMSGDIEKLREISDEDLTAVLGHRSPGSDYPRLREISDEDLTAVLGHRSPGSDYPSTHPPLAEMGEYIRCKSR